MSTFQIPVLQLREHGGGLGVDEPPASHPAGLMASALRGSLLPAVPPPRALGILSPGVAVGVRLWGPDSRQGPSSQVEPLPLQDWFSEPGCTVPEAAATRQKSKSVTAAQGPAAYSLLRGSAGRTSAPG